MVEERSVETVRSWYADAHAHVLDLVREVDDETLFRQPTAGELPAGWYLWHLARHADQFAFLITGTPQQWHSQGLAAKWGFALEQVGRDETGNDVEQSEALSLTWPSRDELIRYAEQSVEAAISATQQIGAENWDVVLFDDQDAFPGVILTGGDLMTRFTWHCGEHLGSIEAILGMIRTTAMSVASAPR